MRRADRLFELIQILRRARSTLTAAQLAEKLKVTPRTVCRDMAALMAMRVPVEGAAGVGYIMRPGYDLPPLMFGHEEVEAIVVGLELLRLDFRHFRADRIVTCVDTAKSFSDQATTLRNVWHSQLKMPHDRILQSRSYRCR